MKYPKHLILDLDASARSGISPYWALAYSNAARFQISNIKLMGFKSSPVVPFITLSAFKVERTPVSSHQKVNIVFLRKEPIYTKLKYSRCPQYDIVSGGMAALFSAFLGFLITEKFGLELLDSGDFYIAFMYGVFSVFSLRPFLKIAEVHESSYRFFSLKYAYAFYSTVFFSFLTGLLSWAKLTKYPQSNFFQRISKLFLTPRVHNTHYSVGKGLD